jgi:hypothetical protein
VAVAGTNIGAPLIRYLIGSVNVESDCGAFRFAMSGRAGGDGGSARWTNHSAYDNEAEPQKPVEYQ